MISLVPAAEPKSFMRQIHKIESLAGLQTRLRGQMPFDANLFLFTRAERLLSNELAEWLALMRSNGFERRRPNSSDRDRVLLARINGIECELLGVIDTGNSNAVSLCWE